MKGQGCRNSPNYKGMPSHERELLGSSSFLPRPAGSMQTGTDGWPVLVEVVTNGMFGKDGHLAPQEGGS